MLLAPPPLGGFRSGLALSLEPLRDTRSGGCLASGRTGSGGTGLSTSVLSACPPALGAWEPSVRNRGAAACLLQTRLLLRVQVQEGLQGPPWGRESRSLVCRCPWGPVDLRQSAGAPVPAPPPPGPVQGGPAWICHLEVTVYGGLGDQG